MGNVNQLDVVQVKAKQLLGSQKVMNTFYVRNISGAAVSDAGFHAGVSNWLQSPYNTFKSSLSSEWQTDTIETYNVTQDRPMVEGGWATHLSGTAATQSLPYQVSALVTFPTGVKKCLGKKYLCGLTEGDTDGAGVWTSGVLSGLAGWAASILGGYSSGGVVFEVGNFRIPLGTFYPYISALVETYAATQRRRKPGVGE